MDRIYIDYVSVSIGALIFLLIRGFWFSAKMFKKNYQKVLKEKKQTPQQWLATIAVALVVSYFIAFLESLLGVTNPLEGIFVGLGIFVGFILPVLIMQTIWEKKFFMYFFIEGGYWFFTLLIIAGFLGA